MMVIPVKIATLSTRCAVPMVYGLQQSDRLKAEILNYSADDFLSRWEEGEFDAALVSPRLAMSASGAKIVSDFCIAPVKEDSSATLADWGVGEEDVRVAAVWIAHEDADEELLSALEEALTLGVERIWEALSTTVENASVEEYEYLTTEVDYLFDAEKYKAVEAYWQRLKKAASHANPG